jgi:hypothetical protein
MPNYYPGRFNADRRNPCDSRYRDMADDIDVPAQPAQQRRTITARFPGTCVLTGQRINPGDEITHQRGVGSVLVRRALVSDVFETSGGVFYRNRAGRCEDAPCCGCCTI